MPSTPIAKSTTAASPHECRRVGDAHSKLIVTDMVIRSLWSLLLCGVLVVLAGKLGDNTRAMDDIRKSGETAASAWRNSEAFVRLMDELREEASRAHD